MESVAEPDIKEGIEYWKSQPANLDGVLGKFNATIHVLSSLLPTDRRIWFWGNNVVLSSCEPPLILVDHVVTTADRFARLSFVPPSPIPRTIHGPIIFPAQCPPAPCSSNKSPRRRRRNRPRNTGRPPPPRIGCRVARARGRLRARSAIQGPCKRLSQPRSTPKLEGHRRHD